MKLSVAPLIYSRTPKKGFNPNFLVYPEGMSDLTKNWAHSFVESALVKADYLSDNCRICSFQNGEYIVIGVCALAEFLCDDPNYCFVDKERRMNHGFFGYVFKKESFKPFFVPKCENEKIPQIFKELYQYVIEYWQDDDTDPVHPKPYREIGFDFEETELNERKSSNISLPDKEENGVVCLPQEQYYPKMISAEYSFCSNMPSIQDAGRSPFDYVFIPKLSQVEVAKKGNSATREPENSCENQQPDGTEKMKDELKNLPVEKRREFINSIVHESPAGEKVKLIVDTAIDVLQTNIIPQLPGFLPKRAETREKETVSFSAMVPTGQKPKQGNQATPIISGSSVKKK